MLCIIFDFDGPIMDSRALSQKALLTIWDDCIKGVAFPNLSDIPLFNTSITAKIALVKAKVELDESDEKEFIELYSNKLKELEHNYVLDTNIRESLESLKNNPNVYTAIISNRRYANLDEVLKSCGIRHFFDYIYGRDSYLPKPDLQSLEDLLEKTKLDKSKLYYIGDQDVDWTFANNASINYYHAGYSKEPCNLSIKNALYVFQTTRELKDLLTNVVEINKINGFHYFNMIKSIGSNNICFFVGSGISIPSGFGNWDKAYKEIFQEVGISHLYNKDNLISSLQLLAIDTRYNRQIFDKFKNYFSPYSSFEPNEYHYILLNINPKRIWTTNYDHLFEKAIIKDHKNMAIIRNDDDLKNNYGKDMLVKMNGDFEDALFEDDFKWNIIFFQEQFTLLKYNRPVLVGLFENDYVSSVMIFIGISFNDPGLNELISTIKYKNLKPIHKHFYLTVPSNDLQQTYFQKLKEKELLQYGIITVYFNTYDEILDYLRTLYIYTNQQHIGIAGSIPYPSDNNFHYCNSIYTVKETTDICIKLGELFASKGFYLASGGAPYVGMPFIEGGYKISSENCNVFFRNNGGKFYKRNVPVKITSSSNISDMRKTFISSLNCLIAISGRFAHDDIGAIEEIELALSKRIPIFIISQFGGQSAEYYDVFLKKIPQHYSNEVASILRDINIKINSMGKDTLTSYLFGEFIDDIEEVLKITASLNLIL